MYSLYFHVPFCQRRCHYCDFYTTTGNNDLIPGYLQALIKEFRIVSHGIETIPVHSIYFGGGTPSLIPASGYEQLISALSSTFDILDDCEISLEANPGTVTPAYLRRLHDLGFNRISLGIQSTDSFDLQRLDRIHSVDEVLSSVFQARMAGFKNINLDLIFGLPWQNLTGWRNCLERAIQLHPQHFSIYALIIEPGTPLYRWYQRGLIAEQDQDLEAEMYELTISVLRDAGYEHYEISNWSKCSASKDFRCRHNLQYWLNQPYFGFGASAHGYVAGKRTVNAPSLLTYIEAVNAHPHGSMSFPVGPATVSVSPVDRQTQMRDHMLLGLRLINDGVSVKQFQGLYGKSMQAVFEGEISFLLKRNLVEWVGRDQRRLRLTSRGVLVANQVFMQFV